MRSATWPVLPAQRCERLDQGIDGQVAAEERGTIELSVQ
jgi:hypothetical protein